MKAFVVCLLLLASWGMAWADDSAKREQIRQEKDAVEERHSLQQQKCRQEFVVTPCLEKARVARQEALQGLRAQEDALDAAQRRQRANDQARRVAGKARAAEVREAASSPRREPKPPQVAASRPAKLLPPPQTPAPGRSAAEKRQREAFEARQKEIKEHKQAVEKRNAERAARETTTPLPVPASAVRP